MRIELLVRQVYPDTSTILLLFRYHTSQRARDRCGTVFLVLREATASEEPSKTPCSLYDLEISCRFKDWSVASTA